MPRILLIKTSSLGDVIHNFPVASDIRKAFPHATIDWVVEEAYVELVRLHPAVCNIIPVALRRWRRQIWTTKIWNEIRIFRDAVISNEYDAILDTQGLLKSALIAWLARGVRHGFDADCAREPISARFYDCTHQVSRSLHAVTRNRQLAASALAYGVESEVDYGLGTGTFPKQDQPYCIFFHGTSRADKLWSQDNWIALGRMIEVHNCQCVIPWGNETEQVRSHAIASGLRMAKVPPMLRLVEMASLIAGARAVIGVDTGLVHLAAALGRPVIAMFAGSDPGLTGVFGGTNGRNLGKKRVPPDAEEVLQALIEMRAI